MNEHLQSLPRAGSSPSLAEEAHGLLTKVDTLVVETVAACVLATDLAHDIRRKRTQWTALWALTIAKTKAAYDEARQSYQAIEKPLHEAEQRLKDRIGAFTLAERRRVEAQTQALVRAERAGAQAEAQRLQDGAIAEAQARQDPEQAARLQAQPISLPSMLALAPPTAALKPEGLSVGETYTFVIEDPAAVPIEYWSVDPDKIKAVVAILKGETRIPGVRVIEKPRVTLRHR